MNRNPVDPNPFDPSLVDAAVLPRGGSLPGTIRAAVTTGQIITLALAKGVLIIAVIFIVLNLDDDGQPDQAAILLPLGGGMLAVLAAGAFAITTFLRSRAISKFRSHDTVSAMREVSTADRVAEQERQRWIDWDAKSPPPIELRQFLADQQTYTLIGQAMMEGAAVMNLVFYMIDCNAVHLVFAAIAFVAILAMIPTIGKTRARIEQAFSGF